jgi:hypothetical protein
VRHGDGYADAALRQESEAVRGATVGTRNETLNRAAFAVARFVPGRLRASDVVDELLAAATAVGLDETEARRTITSALKARGS